MCVRTGSSPRLGPQLPSPGPGEEHLRSPPALHWPGRRPGWAWGQRWLLARLETGLLFLRPSCPQTGNLGRGPSLSQGFESSDLPELTKVSAALEPLSSSFQSVWTELFQRGSRGQVSDTGVALASGAHRAWVATSGVWPRAGAALSWAKRERDDPSFSSRGSPSPSPSFFCRTVRPSSVKALPTHWLHIPKPPGPLPFCTEPLPEQLPSPNQAELPSPPGQTVCKAPAQSWGWGPGRGDLPGTGPLSVCSRVQRLAHAAATTQDQ